jgi:hypothetical protein
MRVDVILVEGKGNAMGSSGSLSIVIVILADLTAGKGDDRTVRLTRICQHATFRHYR